MSGKGNLQFSIESKDSDGKVFETCRVSNPWAATIIKNYLLGDARKPARVVSFEQLPEKMEELQSWEEPEPLTARPE